MGGVVQHDEREAARDSQAVVPSAGRRFGDEETQRILQTAADLQARSPSASSDATRGLTLEELRQIAEEAGIDPRFVDLAASHEDAPVDRKVSGLAGGAYQWHFHSSLEGEIRDGDRDRLVQSIRSVMGQKGDLAEVFGRLEWSHDDGAGPVIIGISVRDGKTEIDVTAVKQTEAGLIHALGIPFGGVFGGAAIAGMFGVAGVSTLPVIAAMGGLSYGATRLGWRLRSQWWERKLRRVVERVSSIVQEAALLTPGEDPTE